MIVLVTIYVDISIHQDSAILNLQRYIYQNYQYADSNKVKHIKAVLIDDIFYKSLSDAAVKLKVSHTTIRNRIKSPNPKFAGYKYADTIQDEIMPSSPLLFENDVDNHEV